MKLEPYDVYIGRGSIWGNPYKTGSREERLHKYREYLLNTPELLAELPKLRGQTLGCFCKPLPCHGDILIEELERRTKEMEDLLKDFIVIDCETTGLNPKEDRIIELACVRFRNFQMSAVFNCLIQFDGELPEITKSLTGYTDQDIACGLKEENAINIFSKFLMPTPIKSLLVGHNLLFDMQFIFEAMRRHNFISESEFFTGANVLDTLTVAREAYPYPHKLDTMCALFNIPLEAHSAYADAIATGQLLIKMMKEQPITNYINVIGYREKYGKPTWYPEHIALKGYKGVQTIWHTKDGTSPPPNTAHVPKKTPEKNKVKPALLKRVKNNESN